MSLKANIINDFLVAFKERKIFDKDTLNLIKSKITEKEKSTPGDTQLEDSVIIDILQSMVKQRNQTIESYSGVEQTDKIIQAINLEKRQIEIIKKYLPQEMSDEIMKVLVQGKLETLSVPDNKKLGEVMSYFKQSYGGQYDAKKLSNIVKSCLEPTER